MNLSKQVIVSSFYSSSGGMSTFVRSTVEFTDPNLINTYLISEDISENEKSEKLISINRSNRLNTCVQLLIELFKVKPTHIQSHGRWYLNLTIVIYNSLTTLIPNIKRAKSYVVKHTDLTENINKSAIFKFIDIWFDKIIFPSVFF